MRASVYGAKSGAVLGLIPGAVLATVLYFASFGFWDRPFAAAILFFGLVAGGVVVVGALLGGAVGLVVEVASNRHGDIDKAA